MLMLMPLLMLMLMPELMPLENRKNNNSILNAARIHISNNLSFKCIFRTSGKQKNMFCEHVNKLISHGIDFYSNVKSSQWNKNFSLGF